MKSFAHRIILLLVLAPLMGFSQGSQAPVWEYQNLPLLTHITNFYFTTPNNGWAAGGGEHILKTTNGGQSWTRISFLNTDFKSFHFINDQTGWVVGGSKIQKTTNGGDTWENQFTGTISQNIFSIHFHDEQNGWAVGSLGTILRTTNGGAIWESQTGGGNIHLQSVYSTSAQTGWAVGNDGRLIRTTNGGSSWEIQASGATGSLNSIKFTDAQTGWISGENTFLKTTDGGASWQPVNTGLQSYVSSFLLDGLNGWVVGSQIAGASLLYKRTTDGGTSWQTINTTAMSTQPFNAFYFFDANTGWSFGSGNGGWTLTKTTDGGSTWKPQSLTMQTILRDVHFPDDRHGWTVGDEGTILHTTNGGNSWQRQESNDLNHLSGVYFTNAQMGWAWGDGKYLLNTTNGGTTWHKNYPGSRFPIRSLSFSDTQNGWAANGSDSLFKTTNGGATWQKMSNGVSVQILSIWFSDNQTGWATGMDGNGSTAVLLKTTNGGETWVDQNNIQTQNVEKQKIRFVDPLNGWIEGSSFTGVGLKTTDGGNTWAPFSWSGRSVFFPDALNGWKADGSFLGHSTDGGQTWQNSSTSPLHTLYSIYFSDPENGWAVGEDGVIIKIRNTWKYGPFFSLVTGKVNQKLTNDCNFNPAAPGIPGMVLKATPGPFYAVTNPQGNYELRLPIDTQAISSYSLSAIPKLPAGFFVDPVCPPGNVYSLSLDSIPDTLSGRNFAATLSECHYLNVDVGSFTRRPCVKNFTFVNYRNQGRLPAPGAYMLVEFPHWVRPVLASIPHIVLSDSVWRFELGTISSGQIGTFQIQDSLRCSPPPPLGLNQCIKATIFPASNCPPPAGWSGASISLSARCKLGVATLGIYNTGMADMTDSTGYHVFLDSILVQSGKVKLLAGDSLKLLVNPGGKTVHLSVIQVPNHPSDAFVSVTLENCGSLNPPVVTSNHFPSPRVPNASVQCQPIRNSWDPNDKTVVPQGFTNKQVIPPDSRLDYTIRFQNTGNDTAFKVVLVDSLDRNLNPESFEMLAASHNHSLDMQTARNGRTFLRWTFANILLPDSNVNELRSHGFVRFRILPKPGLSLGTKVLNKAAIYFDFNPPVITNQTLTTFDNFTFTDPSLNNQVQVISAVAGKVRADKVGVNLFPNPVTHHSLTADFSLPGNLVLFNAKGQKVFQKEFTEGEHRLPIHLKAGLYMAQIQTAKGTAVVKVVVK